MGSESNTSRIDASVGGLVWVRRRNGSWWPGRIMGLHELSESCLVSPRSGTPVKLLGREDASVDWYNLEKSKRVKAFRCGEYDECIEKAKASAALNNKKAVKYARREDAILHALELESAHESGENHYFQLRVDGSASTKHDTLVRQPHNMFSPGQDHEHMNGKGSMLEVSSAQELSQSGISFEDPNHITTPKLHSLQKKRRKTPNDSEDDGIEGTKRMRGLEDLGMGVASKRKAAIQLESAFLSEPNVCNVLSNGNAINSSKSSLKNRQSQAANVYGNLKRKNRRRPLTKVLESTAMVSVPVLCDQGASPGQSSLQRVTDSKVSALESTDSKKTNVSVVVNNNSDCTGASCERETSLNASEHTCDAGVDNVHIHSESKDSELSSMSEFLQNDCSDGLFDVPFIGEEKHTEGFFPLFASSASRKLQSDAMGKQFNEAGSVLLGSEGLDESGSTSFSNVSPRLENGISKWQLKGKRNSRSLSKKTSKSLNLGRSVDRDDESDAFLVGAHHIDGLSVGFSRIVEISTFNEPLMVDHSAHWSNRIAESSYLDSINYGWRNSINSVILPTEGIGKSAVAKSTTQVRNKELHSPRGVPVSPPTSHRSLHHQSCFTTHSRYHIADGPSRDISGVSSLFDVNLEVRASYRGHHVPLVSLMSKLNGKAIVGHPLTVEVQDDGYCDLLLSSIDCCPTSISDELYDVPTENMSDQSMDVASSSILLDRGAKAFRTQASTGYTVKSHIVSRNPIQYSSYPKKSPKIRKCGLLSKKTRKLSSFAFVHEQQTEEVKKPMVEKAAGPVNACVPLKVVFSRINEAVNCSRNQR